MIMSVPYQASLFGGLFPSKSIMVSGTVPPRAIRFHINLKVGPDTAFHLNPRFNEQVIIRNSQFSGHWGPEERHLLLLLHPGQAFTIWILCELQCFLVAVNGQHQFDYNHRVADLRQIDRLEIEGDVSLSGLSNPFTLRKPVISALVSFSWYASKCGPSNWAVQQSKKEMDWKPRWVRLSTWGTSAPQTEKWLDRLSFPVM
ncbi:UNVERIFIED_CONTAM: hypothetical protein K2H54_039416 [Gekko kuhli]